MVISTAGSVYITTVVWPHPNPNPKY